MSPARQTDSPESAGRLWPPTWPMGLTMLRLLLLPFFLYAVVSDADHLSGGARYMAVAIFAVMALSDKLDGYIARKLNQTSKLGAMLDPVADKLLITCSVFLLAIDRIAPVGYAIPLLVVACVYGKDVVTVLGYTILVALTGPVSMRPHWPGKIATFLQLMLVLVTLIAPDLHALHPAMSAAVIRVLWVAVAAISVIALVDYIVTGVYVLRDRRRGN